MLFFNKSENVPSATVKQLKQPRKKTELWRRLFLKSYEILPTEVYSVVLYKIKWSEINVSTQKLWTLKCLFNMLI